MTLISAPSHHLKAFRDAIQSHVHWPCPLTTAIRLVAAFPVQCKLESALC
jgi:hypothetical protein